MRLHHMIYRLRSEKLPARFLASRLLRLTRLCMLFTIQKNAYRLRFYPTAGSATFWVDPAPSREELFIEAFLKPGDTYVDVGANIGALALLAASKVGPSGYVHAFEAHPEIFRFLQGNIQLNGFSNISANNYAVADQPGDLAFTDLHSDDQNSICQEGSIIVRANRLDDLLPVDRPIALLKIDVEGAEKLVLDGAPQTLARTSAIYFEYSDRMSAAFGYNLADLEELLLHAGFTVRPVAATVQGEASDYLAVRT